MEFSFFYVYSQINQQIKIAVANTNVAALTETSPFTETKAYTISVQIFTSLKYNLVRRYNSYFTKL
jgi:hypothetical protein